MRAQFRSRIRIVLAFIVLAAILIFVRLYFIQIVHGEEYAQKADRQFASGGSGFFDRGSIYFTRKDGTLISAATLATGFLVAINPQTLTDPEAAYAAISAAASSTLLTHDAFLAAAAKKASRVRRVDEAMADIAAYAASGSVKVCGLMATRKPVASVAAEMSAPSLRVK